MTEKEFVYWLRGIVDSTEFMPTKKTWDTIQDKLKEVESSDEGSYRQPPYVVINPYKPSDTPGTPPQILC